MSAPLGTPPGGNRLRGLPHPRDLSGRVSCPTKSTPGDGQHGKGSKGLPSGDARQGTWAFTKGLFQGLKALRRR